MSTDAMHRRRLPGRPLAATGSLLRTAGFWLAVALPLVYLPLLVLGPPAVADPGVVVAVVGTNLLAIVVGHGHEPTVGRRARGD